jgi:hypothetical protein
MIYTPRRNFLLQGALTAGAACLHWPAGAYGQAGGSQPKPAEESTGFPRQNPKLVEETVGASHGKFDRVKELVTAYPELAKCSWDGGFGDWEAPIDAASHVGNREIALFLLDHGARPTIFTFAMLGHVEVVKAMLTAQPELRKTLGPHGFNLFHHAKVGGDAAAAVRDYLKEIGETEAVVTSIPKETMDAITGRYETAGPEAARFEILTNKQGLAVQGAVGAPRNLRLLPDGSMHPVGAQSVRFTFEVVDGQAKSSSVMMGGKALRALRVQ